MGFSAIINLLPFLNKHKKVLVTVLLVGGLFLYIMHLKSNISDLTVKKVEYSKQVELLQADIQKREHDMGTANKSIGELTKAVDKQNQSIANMNKKLIDKSLEIARLKVELENKKAENDKKVDVIMQEEKPKTCEDAITYLIKGVGDLLP